jgi:hypothetical protein
LSSLVLDFIGYRVCFLPPSRACSIRFWGFIRARQKHWLVGIKCLSTWSAWLLGEKWDHLFLSMQFFVSIEQKVKNLNFSLHAFVVLSATICSFVFLSCT